MDILRVGTSAGGAKPKAIIAYNAQTNEVRSGQIKAPDGFTYWLLKFDGVEDNKLKDNPVGTGRIEYSYSPSGKWTSQHQMSLNNKRDNFTYDDLLTVSKTMDIKNGREIIQQILATVSEWESFAKEADVKKEHIKQIKETLRFIAPS
jgi:serine/threonine-protein kinase HipA